MYLRPDNFLYIMKLKKRKDRRWLIIEGLGTRSSLQMEEQRFWENSKRTGRLEGSGCVRLQGRKGARQWIQDAQKK